MFLNLGEELCKKPGNTLFVRIKAKVRLKHKRAPIVITYKFFEDDEKKVRAREKVETSIVVKKTNENGLFSTTYQLIAPYRILLSRKPVNGNGDHMPFH